MLQTFLWRLLTLLVSIQCIKAEEPPTIETSTGLVKGFKQTTYFSGTEYYSFKGIPYGEPPIGQLRFEVGQNTLDDR